MIEILKRLYWDLVNKQARDGLTAYLLRDLPGEFGILVRRRWYTKRFKKAGKNLNILAGTYIINPGNIECGDNVSIGICNYIQAGGSLIINSDTMLGPYVKIWTQTHRFERNDIPMRAQGYTYSPVEIGCDVWVGANAFIMPGVRIGNKCIISANSVVGAKTYPDGIILAGYPARKIGER